MDTLDVQLYLSRCRADSGLSPVGMCARRAHHASSPFEGRSGGRIGRLPFQPADCLFSRQIAFSAGRLPFQPADCRCRLRDRPPGLSWRLSSRPPAPRAGEEPPLVMPGGAAKPPFVPGGFSGGGSPPARTWSTPDESAAHSEGGKASGDPTNRTAGSGVMVRWRYLGPLGLLGPLGVLGPLGPLGPLGVLGQLGQLGQLGPLGGPCCMR